MLGLLALFGIALGLVLALLTAMLAWEMVHPPRRTAAWAIARGLPCDPGDMKLPFEEWRLDRPEGAHLAVWEINAADRLNQPEPLTAVFAHGWGHGRVSSLQRIAAYVSLVDRIVLYDLRGHGDSSGSCTTLGDGDEVDLLALLDRLGAGPFLLVGHSMGAVVALRAAMKRRPSAASVASSRIVGIIAYGPYLAFRDSLHGRLRLNGLPARPISDVALLIHRLRGVRPGSIDVASMRDLRVPLLVIQGVEDQVSPVERTRAMVAAAPDGRLLEVHGAAHTDAHAIDQAAHDQAVAEFIARVRQAGQASTPV